jgi:hypothetical protein
MIIIDILCNGSYLNNKLASTKKKLSYQGVTLIQDNRVLFTSVNNGNNDLVFHWFEVMQFYIKNFSDETMLYGGNVFPFLESYMDIFQKWYLRYETGVNTFYLTATVPSQLFFILPANNLMTWDDLNNYYRLTKGEKI